MVSEANWTVRRSLRAAENTGSSNSNLVNHNITTISSSCIIDMDLITTSTVYNTTNKYYNNMICIIIVLLKLHQSLK